MTAKKILLLGGTGAMGVYLAPELIRSGYKVDVTTRSAGRRSGLNLRFIQGDARNIDFLNKVLKTKYDVIIDFMVYPTTEFRERVELLLSNTEQYIFLSTYRIFADSGNNTIVEASDRLLDTSADNEYLKTDEYALQKAREEDILKNSKYTNWTIVRPSITYSKNRFQLGVFEANVFIKRALEGKTIVFPSEMLDKYTTMTWAGDVAKMISKLVLNKDAYSETFNVVTSESHKWSEVISFYRDILDLKIKYISLNEFLNIYSGKYQVMYDRMYNRKMNNTKILRVTGLKQEDLTQLKNGLRYELSRFINKPEYNNEQDPTIDQKINNITESLIQKTRKKVRVRSRLRTLKRKTRIRTRLKDTKSRARVRTRLKYVGETYKNKQKDGLIVSLTSVFNYGNIVQRYALKTFLKKQGYEFDSVTMPSWVDNIDNTILGETRSFVEKYIGGKEFDPGYLQGYTNYLVGSDQVWRNWYGDEWAAYSPYFLEFVSSKKANRISYAASFGVDNLPDAGIHEMNRKEVSKLLSVFNNISVREDSGVQLVHELMGSTIPQVSVTLDPTLLLSRDDYSDLIDRSDVASYKTSNVFCYILDQTDIKKTYIKKVARSYDDDYQIINPNINERYKAVEEWLKGFRDAKFVVTDSFHGTIFAIINHTDFMVFNNSSRGSARFETLLTALGIKNDRLLDDSKPDNEHEEVTPIDWADVDKRLSELRRTSSEWLHKAIEGSESGN